MELYGLGKHGDAGDCNTEKPGFFNIVKKKKWEAWNSKKGMDINEAKTKFIELAKQILSKEKLWIKILTLILKDLNTLFN